MLPLAVDGRRYFRWPSRLVDAAAARRYFGRLSLLLPVAAAA